MIRKIYIKSLLLTLFVGLSLCCFLGTSCQRLDRNLFNNDNKIEGYKWDNFTGTQDFILDDSYLIQDSMRHLFTLSSQLPTESMAQKIYALYVGEIAKIATDTVILYCHGNKWHMDFYWQRTKLLAHTGSKHRYGVMTLDYRSYGLSEGEPTEETMYADVKAALQWLKEKGLTSDRLIMYGFSLGSAPACELTARPYELTPKKIILEAPFASAQVMVDDGANMSMPATFVTNLKLDNAEEIKSIQQPFCWIHGKNDLFLNYQTHGQLVFDNYRGPYKESHLIEGADHGEVPSKWGFKAYSDALLSFITKP